MRRRSRAGGEQVKTRRRKTAARKRLNAPKVRGRGTPAHDQDTEIARVIREREEAREQQKATAEILRVIRTSPADVQPVFETIVRNAVSLCGSLYANVFRFDGELLHFVAAHNVGPSPVDLLRTRYPMRPDSSQVAGRVLLTKSVVRLEDALTDPDYDQRFARAIGFRRLLGVPMLREGEPLGVIVAGWAEPGPVPKVQEELLTTFADQAVIAIENVRLFEAEQARTRELSETLEQQTATSQVLGVISSSPGELQPVFQTILENATRICEAKFGNLFRFDGKNLHLGAQFNTPAALLEVQTRRGPFQPAPGSHLDRVMRTKRVSHTADYAAEAVSTPAVALGGARSFVAVPMLKDDSLIGVICIYRQEVRPFTDKQITLVQNFAAQAVIAIENARLLNELRESLEQQTATADILRIISASPGDLEPVFVTILDKALHLCEAAFGFVTTYDGVRIERVAQRGVPEALAAYFEAGMDQARPGDAHWRLVEGEDLIHNLDQMDEDAYRLGNPLRRAVVDLGGARTALVVALRKDKVLLGALTVYRKEVRPFTDQQVSLVQNFAAQAVIAIENARLLNELRESLQQQTATADVLKLISRSTFDLKSVLNTLVESAARLCEADIATIARQKDEYYHVVASYGYPPSYQEYVETVPLERGRGSVFGRVLLECKPVQIVDVLADPEYTMRELQKRAGFRTVLGVPLLREGVPIGLLNVNRTSVRAFTDKQIELVTTFADQAAIAIENVRLFDEIQDKSRQLEEASQHKSQFLANMSHELRTPLNAILGYSELMADGAYGEPSEKMLGILKRLEANGRHLLGLINDVLDLSKIEAGQLVLELSDYCIQDIAQTVRSTLEPLAADKKLAFKVELARELPPGRGDGRRLTQVLINLVGNAIKFTDAGEVAIKAEANNGSFCVSVRDTGPGISAADQTKLFQEFQQADNAITKKKGGTGLGLAISKRIIEMHGGKIWVESQPGQGSTFAFSLPVIVERQVEAA
jgi:signal transduction histidine kinase